MSDVKETRLIRVDMHCHTWLSKDSLNEPRRLVESAARHGMGALCVTDHNRLAASLALSKMDDLPIPVVASEEVKTTEGELIGYFLTEQVPRGLPPEETARLIKQQGGLVGVPHPFDSMRTRSRLEPWALDRLVDAGLVDIIEVLNARAVDPEDNRKALEFARRHGLPMSGGSDAHTLAEVGRAYAEVPPFTTPAELLEGLKSGRVGGRVSSRLVHFGSAWARVARALPGARYGE